MRLKYTGEQEQSLQAAMEGGSFKQIARAGCGKTFICREIGRLFEHSSQPDMLYIVFTNAGAAEAAKTFTPNVVVSTFNSVAKNMVDPRIQDKLHMAKEPSFSLASRYGLKSSSFVSHTNQLITLSSSYMGRLVQKSIENFCRSAEKELSLAHVETPEGCDEKRASYLREKLFPHVERYWHEQTDPNCTRGIIHGVYVKLFHQANHKIDCTIVFDEAQDADPVMLDILRSQESQVIWVGDDFQQIYPWRGAINALDYLDLPTYHLTQSFRFGQNVGDLATSLLKCLNNQVPVRGLETKETKVVYNDNDIAPDVYLCRTNAQAMDVLAQALSRGEKTSIDSQSLWEFSNFAAHAKTLIGGGRAKHPVLGMFVSWKDFRDYTESPYGSEYRTFVKLIDDYGIENLGKIIASASPMDRCQNFVTTIHKFKGMEAPRVKLCEFISHQKDPSGISLMTNKEEIMLLYVGLTRATGALDLSAVADEMKMLMRGMRPSIANEIQQGFGTIVDPQSQSPCSSSASRLDTTGLYRHLDYIARASNRQSGIHKTSNAINM
tara:strand:+ start:2084 stop:3733 length:1650 start_codon:yes stop_codon:yes gene_type:complete